ncbi:MAG: type VII secretion protein EssC [Lachnospiraceae bacterium]|nr:type VII secretion protein EssC [Lachnospiraceae bacterium]
MSLLMTVFFENGFSEHYFPAVDNRKHPIAVSPYISGLDDELVLNVEVWDGKWTINIDKKYELLKGGQPVTEAVLENGLVLEGTVKKDETWFSIKVDEVGEDSTGFSKYLLRRDKIQSLSIGSGSSCDIIYTNRFVSEKHAEIFFEGENTYVTDNNSTNGTFLNGRAVSQKVPVKYGDVIYVVGLKIVYLGQLIAINNPMGSVKVKLLDPVVIPEITDESEENEYEKVYFLRAPRQLKNIDDESLSIERCAQQQPYKAQPLIFTIGPSFTMVIPIALAALMTGEGGFGASSLVMSGGAAVMAAVWAIANNKYNKNEANKSEQSRKTTYIDYINRLEKKLTEKAEYNRGVLLEQYPSADEMLSFVGVKQSRLWEKSSAHRDFLSVRLGIGDIKAPNEINLPSEDLVSGYDPLNDLPDKLRKDYGTLKQVPVSVSLYDNRIVGIVSSDPAKRNALIRLFTLNLASNFPYTELRLCYAFQAKEYDDLSFLRWIPHTWTPDGKLRMVASDSRSLGDVMYFLSDLFRERMEKENTNNSDKKEKVLPHYVIFVTDISLIAGEPIAKFLMDPPADTGVTVVFCAESAERLPSKCNTVISDENGVAKAYTISTQEGFSNGLNLDNVSLPAMDYFARNLANFELRDTSGNSEIPDMLTFLDMYKVSKVEDLDIYHRWLENRTYETMKAMVGQKSGGRPVYLDIHEKYHGPHGLVAGTTGSGKSETLQSYILSMAINYHPHEVAFILIDYKGGGMAQSFEGLPHLAGMITNLGGNGTTRALLSINAEIKHRQRVFNDYKIKHIDQYIELYRNGEADEPMPHLIIIADEFAELKKEQPEFVRALVSAARVGRSLGVNLILATQKPGGVVDDEIWSNTRFRICLRVADKQDSNEMLKRPDAAFITGTGRGYMQVGNDEIFEEFQSGWSGAQYTPDVPFDDGSKGFVRMVGITGKPEKIGNKKKKKSGDNLNKVTQLDEIVKYAGKLSAENNIEPLRQIWLAPLPGMLYLDDLDTEGLNTEHLAIPIGLADDPENQRQFTVSLDFIRDGHLLICGASGAGKTTLIETIVFSAANTYSADQVNFYIADFSGRTMSAFAGLPHTGAVCLEGEDEKIENVMNFIRDELERRKNVMSQKGIGSFRDYLAVEKDMPMILLIIDNYAAFNESYEEYDDLFVQLSREAAGYGIYLIFSCNNSSDLRGRIRQGFTKGIGMQLPDRFEYDSVIGMRTEILPDDRVSGRGLIKEGNPLEFQTALPVRSTGSSIMLTIREIISEKFAGIEGISKKSLNKYGAVSSDEILKGAKDPDRLIIGKNINGDGVVSADLDKTLVYTVSGGSKSGKTNFLTFAAKQMKEKGSRVFIFDGPLREMEEAAGEINADGYITSGEDLFAFMEQTMVPELTERNELVYNAREAGTSVKKALKDYDRIVLIINSAVDFMEAIYNEAADMSEFLEIVFDKGLEHKIHFIMGVSFREYDECSQYNAFRMAMDMKTGLHLGGELAEQRIFDFDISVGEYDRKSPAGSAITVTDGETVEIMTPYVREQ